MSQFHPVPAEGVHLSGHAPSSLEIRVGGKWVEVNEHLFRSWAGERRFFGAPYTGTVFLLGTTKVARS